jgi:hypothetical protein
MEVEGILPLPSLKRAHPCHQPCLANDPHAEIALLQGRDPDAAISVGPHHTGAVLRSPSGIVPPVVGGQEFPQGVDITPALRVR